MKKTKQTPTVSISLFLFKKLQEVESRLSSCSRPETDTSTQRCSNSPKQRLFSPSMTHTHTQTCPLRPLLGDIMLERRIPFAFLPLCLMSTHHALASAHTYSQPACVCIQCGSAHADISVRHCMHGCIKSMTPLWLGAYRGYSMCAGMQRGVGGCLDHCS